MKKRKERRNFILHREDVRKKAEVFIKRIRTNKNQKFVEGYRGN